MLKDPLMADIPWLPLVVMVLSQLLARFAVLWRLVLFRVGVRSVEDPVP